MKLTKQQKSLLDKVRGGGAVQSLTSDEGKIYTTQDGERLNSRAIGNLIIKGALVPNGDGLFDGFTQTYRAAT